MENHKNILKIVKEIDIKLGGSMSTREGIRALLMDISRKLDDFSPDNGESNVFSGIKILGIDEYNTVTDDGIFIVED